MPLGPSAADPYRRKLALGSENQDADYSGMGINNTRAEAAAKARMLKDRFNAAQKAFIREKQLGTIKFGSAEDIAGRSGLRGVADEAAAYENAARPAQRVFTPEQNAQNAMTISEQARTLTGRPMYSQADAAALGQRASAGQAAMSRRDDMRAGELFQLARKIGEPRERYEQIDQQMNTFADEQRRRMIDNARADDSLLSARRRLEEQKIANASTKDWTDPMNQVKLDEAHAKINYMFQQNQITKQQAEDEHRQADLKAKMLESGLAENAATSAGRVAVTNAQNDFNAKNVGNTPQDKLNNILINKQISDVTDPLSPGEIAKKRQLQDDAAGLYGVGNEQFKGVIENDIRNLQKAFGDVIPGNIQGEGIVSDVESQLTSADSLSDYVDRLAKAGEVSPDVARRQAAQLLIAMPRPNSAGTYKTGIFGSILPGPGVISLSQRKELTEKLNNVRKKLQSLANGSANQRMLSPSVQINRPTQNPQRNPLYQPVENNQ